MARRVAGELGRDAKSVHREVAMLTATGLIERRAADEVAVGWDRAVTELFGGHGIPCPRRSAGIGDLADALERSEDGGVRGVK